MNIFTINKKNLSSHTINFFILALLVRLVFLFFQDANTEKLIEDELLYWNSSIMYLEKGILEDSIMAERMKGIFIYAKILLTISFKNIKFYLILQCIVDALTCVMIYKIGKDIFPKQRIYIYLSALLSPLMIILSSQVLSETIFLLFFSIFLYYSVQIILEKKNLYFKFALAGIFLGLSTSIRSITYPLIFLSLIPFVIILGRKEIYKYKILIFSIVFLSFSLFPISLRIYDNFKIHSSFALTSQTGTHLANWVTPMIISETQNINRRDAIKIINQVASKYNLTGNPYEKDKILRKIGFEVLSEVKITDIAFLWVKTTLINLISPSILIDKNLRSLPHPSFYETGNMFAWLKIILSDSTYYKYLFIISIASITSLFTLISLIIGPVFVFKKDRMIFYLTILYILYFSLINGPILSPKYIFPILPCIFLYQGITLYKIINLIRLLLEKYLKD